MLEKLGFQSLMDQAVTSKGVPRAMDLYRFVLGIVLGLYINGDDLQFHIGRRPNPFPHNRQHPSGNIQMERIDEPPERGLYRQLGDFENTCQDWVAGDEPQLIQPRKADVEAIANPSLFPP